MQISTDLMAFAASRHAEPPQRLGQRYDATRFLPDPGNTVVCHLDFGEPAHSEVLRARARMMALPGAEDVLLFTPEESLHMTVFEGVLDNRRRRDAWPDWITLDAPVDAVTQGLTERFRDFQGESPFAVRASALQLTGLALSGATAADNEALKAWREALTGPFGYRQAEHNTYRHHMTFAYPIKWLPDDLLPIWDAEMRAIYADLTQAAAVIPLRSPAFCRFADMTHFEKLTVLPV